MVGLIQLAQLCSGAHSLCLTTKQKVIFVSANPIGTASPHATQVSIQMHHNIILALHIQMKSHTQRETGQRETGHPAKSVAFACVFPPVD